MDFCVLVLGDQVSRRGALTGGYYDSRKSRLDCQQSILTVQKEMTDCQQRHEEVQNKLERIF